MTSSPDYAFNPEIVSTLTAAFEKAWPFIERDALLSSIDIEERRSLLALSLMTMATHGERDPLRLANSAIGNLRRLAHSRAQGRIAA
jgi:hypothetical protein